jgi:hypothetical protein
MVRGHERFRLARDGGRLRVSHDRCGEPVEAWYPTMPGREADILALCHQCEVTALVPVSPACCGASEPFRWAEGASPDQPRIERTCSRCGEREMLMLAKREPQEPPEPAVIFRERAVASLVQAASQFRRVADGELDASILDGLGHVRITARHLDEGQRGAIEAVLRDARVLLDAGELVQAAEALERAAATLLT